MRTRLTAIVLAAILLTCLAPFPTDAQTTSASSLIVKVVAGLTTDQQSALVGRNGGTITSSIPPLRLLVVSVSDAEVAATLARYQADSQVQNVEENKVRVSEAIPSDALYANQWALPRIGWDQVFGVVNPTGSAKVALLDTGVDASHPELAGKVVAGTSILDGSDGLTDPSGHGTWLAGIIAARTNNGLEGIAGVAYAGVQVMPVTVLNANGEGMDSDVIAGVIWAADHGANVILMAFSNPGFSPNLQDAIDYAWSRGAVLVASVGNNASSEPHFPAGGRGVMGVAATDQGDGLASFSNDGQAIFIAAPGVDIATIEPGGAYTAISGTSAAAAHVAGVAAFMKAVDRSLSNGVIVGRIARNADPAGTQDQTGNGRVYMPRALTDTSTESIQPAGASPVGAGGPFVGPYRADAINTTTTITSSLNPSSAGQSVTFTARTTITSTGVPVTVGKIQIVDGGNNNCNGPNAILLPLTAPNANGQVSVTTSALAAGSHTIRACHQGTQGNDGTQDSNASLTQTVQAGFSITFDASSLGADVAGTTAVLSVTIGNAAAVPVTKAELPKSFTVASGTTVVYAYNSPLPSTSATKRYRWASTSGLGQSAQSATFTASAAGTVTASYTPQFQITFAQSGLGGDTTGTLVTVNASAKTTLPFTDFFDANATVTFAFTDPVASTVTGKRYRLASNSTNSPLTVSASTTVTSTYVAQIQVTFAQTGLAGDATGTLVTVNGSAKTTLPLTDFFDSNASVTFAFTDPVASTVTGKRYRLASTSASSPLNVSAPTTVTASYTAQIQVTFAQTGLGSDATGTVVTVNGSPKTSLPFSDFFDANAGVAFTFTDPVTSSTAGKRYRLASTSTSSPLTVTAPVTVTATYVAQIQITFAQTGLGSDATGTLVTINASAKTTLPFTDYFDVSAGITFAFTDPVASTVAGKRYRLASTSTASPLTVTTTMTVTATYVPQFQVTFAQTGLGSDASGTLVTVNVSAKTALPFSDYFDVNTSVTFAFTDPVTSSTAGKRYRLASTSTPSPLSVTAPITVTATYVAQFQVTFAQTGLASDATGTLLTVNASAKTVLPFSDYFDASASITFAFSDPVISSLAGKRYRLASTNVASPLTVTTPTTVTATYVPQFQVTFAQTGLGPDTTGTLVTVNASAKPTLPFSDYFDATAIVTFAFSDPVTSSVAGKRYRLASTSTASPLTVSAPTTVTATYVVQFQITFMQTGLGGDTTNTLVAVNTSPKTTLPFSDYFDANATVTFAFTDPVTSSVAGKRYHLLNVSASSPLIVSAATTVTASYIAQFQVTFAQTGLAADATGTLVTVNLGAKPTLPFSDYFDANTSVTFAYTDPVASTVPGKRYRLVSTTTTSPLLVTAPTTVTASYVAQFQLTLAITSGVPNGLSNISGATSGTFYDTGTILTLAATTPVADGLDKQWGFDTWTGDVPSSPNSSNTVMVTMDQSRSITANYSMPTATFAASTPINEGSASTLALTNPSTITATPSGFSYSFACDGLNASLAASKVGAVTINTASCTFNDNGTYTVKGRVFDKNNGFTTYPATVAVLNVPPTITGFTGSAVPVPVLTPTSVTASFTDPGTADTHTCKFLWDDTTDSAVTAPGAGNGSCTTTHTYSQAGVYTVGVTVTDKDGGSDAEVYQYIVVYDPSAGFVTGGGWIMSPPGAYVADSALTGKATFGFVSKYQKGATVPTGQTEFQFQVANFNFHSETYQYLVIAGAKAQYKGEGTVNGSGHYGFILTATDGQVTGGKGVDRFRIKIWDIDRNDAIVYDNVLGATDDIDRFDPQAIGGGSIVIHSGK